VYTYPFLRNTHQLKFDLTSADYFWRAVSILSRDLVNLICHEFKFTYIIVKEAEYHGDKESLKKYCIVIALIYVENISKQVFEPAKTNLTTLWKPLQFSSFLCNPM
jgi:hypothetical protein